MLKSWNEMRKVDVTKFVQKRDGNDYLPWADCMQLLHDNGAEKVFFTPLTTENGSSLFMSEQTFTDKNGKNNRCYEVRVQITIDDDVFEQGYPLLSGSTPIRDDILTQQRVHTAIARAFVKGVAIHTGLGFGLWLKVDDSNTDSEEDNLSKHKLKAIKDRMQEEITACMQKGMSFGDVAKELGMDEEVLRSKFSYFAELSKIEKKLLELMNK